MMKVAERAGLWDNGPMGDAYTLHVYVGKLPVSQGPSTTSYTMFRIRRWIAPPPRPIPLRQHPKEKVDRQSGDGCTGVQR